MSVQGIGSQTQAVQQNLLGGAGQESSNMAESSQAKKSGSVQAQMNVSVLKSSLEQQESQAQQLLQGLGIGQNVDIQA